MGYFKSFCWFLSISFAGIISYGQCDASFSASTTMPCTGNTVSFTNTSAGSTSYTWKIDEVVFSSSTNSSYLFNTAGDYVVELIASDGGVCVDSTTIILTVSQTPVINVNVTPTTIYMNDSVFVSFTSTGILPDAIFTWSFCDGVNLNYNTPFYYSWTAPGSSLCVCAQVTNPGACVDNDCFNGITVLYFSNLADLKQAGVSVYPNPVSDQFYIEFDKDYQTPVLIQIYNQSGQNVYSENFQNEKIIIQRGNLSAGIYEVIINSNGTQMIFPVVFE